VTVEAKKRREGGRGRRAPGRLPQLPWQSLTNPYAPMEVLSADQLEAIHLTSLRILEEFGIELMSPGAVWVTFCISFTCRQKSSAQKRVSV